MNVHIPELIDARSMRREQGTVDGNIEAGMGRVGSIDEWTQLTAADTRRGV